MTTPTPTHSPLEPIFAGHERIPFAFAEQFLHREDFPYSMKLTGVMHRIWHRPRYLSPLFRLLGRLGILVPHNAENVPTTLVVTPGRKERDGLFHVWDRTLAFDRPVRFRTIIIYDPSLDKVVDLVGPRDVLYMVWDAKFHPPGKFTQLNLAGEAARFFPVGDSGALATAVIDLLGDPIERDRLAELGRRLADEHDWSVIGGVYRELYDEVVT